MQLGELVGEHAHHHEVVVLAAGEHVLAEAGLPYDPALVVEGDFRRTVIDNFVEEYGAGRTPKHGAIWLTYYPHVMVESYPHVLVVSTLFPRGPRKTLNLIEFFYPEEIVAFEREFVEAQQAAYMETCVEDDEIALRMDAGRRALMQRGDDEVGPYQSPMEDGMQHFHEWYRAAMGPHAPHRTGGK